MLALWGVLQTCTSDKAIEAARKAWHLYEGDAGTVLRTWEASKPKTTTLESLWGGVPSAQTRQVQHCSPIMQQQTIEPIFIQSSAAPCTINALPFDRFCWDLFGPIHHAIWKHCQWSTNHITG